MKTKADEGDAGSTEVVLSVRDQNCSPLEGARLPSLVPALLGGWASIVTFTVVVLFATLIAHLVNGAEFNGLSPFRLRFFWGLKMFLFIRVAEVVQHLPEANPRTWLRRNASRLAAMALWGTVLSIASAPLRLHILGRGDFGLHDLYLIQAIGVGITWLQFRGYAEIALEGPIFNPARLALVALRDLAHLPGAIASLPQWVWRTVVRGRAPLAASGFLSGYLAFAAFDHLLGQHFVSNIRAPYFASPWVTDFGAALIGATRIAVELVPLFVFAAPMIASLAVWRRSQGLLPRATPQSPRALIQSAHPPQDVAAHVQLPSQRFLSS